MCDFCGRGFRIKYDMVQHRLKTHYGVPAKRRKNPGNKMLPPQTTTTTYITTKDGTMIEDQVTVMTLGRPLITSFLVFQLTSHLVISVLAKILMNVIVFAG